MLQQFSHSQWIQMAFLRLFETRPGPVIFQHWMGKNLVLLWQETARKARKIFLQSVDSIESVASTLRDLVPSHPNSTRPMDKL